MLATADDEVFLGSSAGSAATSSGGVAVGSGAAGAGTGTGSASAAAGSGAGSGSASAGAPAVGPAGTEAGAVGAVSAVDAVVSGTPSELDVVGSWELKRDACTVEEDGSPLASPPLGGAALSTVPSLSTLEGTAASVGSGADCSSGGGGSATGIVVLTSLEYPLLLAKMS